MVDEIKPEMDKIQQAQEAVKKIEEAEKRLDEKIAKLTELETNRILASTAGGRVEPEVKIDTPKEYSDKVMSGEIKAR
jgi:hypothetical protein